MKEPISDILISQALSFAALAHGNQTRKVNGEPYILHPMEVANIIHRAAGHDPVLIAAGILHDTIEDVKVTFETIEKMFGTEVANYVQMMSDDKSLPWRERWQTKVEKIKNCGDPRFVLLAYADMLSNLRSLKRDFDKYGDDIWLNFNEKDPAKQSEKFLALFHVFADYKRVGKLADTFDEVFKIHAFIFHGEPNLAIV
jgi:(p)ppGpp synthase/HD superfamily hydrolase